MTVAEKKPELLLTGVVNLNVAEKKPELGMVCSVNLNETLAKHTHAIILILLSVFSVCLS